MSKFISWNIDSLNAALTSDSPRAQLSRDVLNTLAGEDADIIAGIGGSVPGLSCRVGQLGTAGQKGLCGDNDSL